MTEEKFCNDPACSITREGIKHLHHASNNVPKEFTNPARMKKITIITLGAFVSVIPISLSLFLDKYFPDNPAIGVLSGLIGGVALAAALLWLISKLAKKWSVV